MAPAGAPDAPVWGFADTHTHEFLNLAFDCHWPSLWGSSGVLLKVGVTELDGGQHLGDTDAYRRDRRKDALLQENGYLVLRFLAEDVGKHLDQVLDGIFRALSHQGART